MFLLQVFVSKISLCFYASQPWRLKCPKYQPRRKSLAKWCNWKWRKLGFCFYFCQYWRNFWSCTGESKTSKTDKVCVEWLWKWTCHFPLMIMTLLRKVSTVVLLRNWVWGLNLIPLVIYFTIVNCYFDYLLNCVPWQWSLYIVIC